MCVCGGGGSGFKFECHTVFVRSGTPIFVSLDRNFLIFFGLYFSLVDSKPVHAGQLTVPLRILQLLPGRVR